MTNKIQIHPMLKNFVKPDDHSKFSPSSADRWLGGCSYSMKASEGIPNEDNKYSVEGTLGHAVAEAVFREREFGIPIPVDLTFSMLALKDKGDEMMIAGNDFYEVCKFWMNNTEILGSVIWWSQEGAIPVFPEESNYGTADFMIVGTKAAVVVDFKYGRKPVSAQAKQLMVYAAGIAKHLNNLPVDESGNIQYNIHAVIHQPRLPSPVSEHCYTIQELWQGLTDILNWIQVAKRNDNEPVEGNHCFWCPANRTKDLGKRCKLKLEKPIKLANECFDQFLADANLTPDTVHNKVARDEALIKLLTLAPAIEEVLKQGEEDLIRRLEAGEIIPGIVIENSYGKRILNAEDEDDAAAMITDMYPSVNPFRAIPATTSIRTLGSLEKEKVIGKGGLDPICTKKVTRTVRVLDDKAKSILDSLSNYAINISNS